MHIWQDYMTERISGREPYMPWFLHDKLKCYRFLEDAGIATATVLREFDSPSEIDLTGIAGDFVLKPTLQSSMKGVMVLTAAGDYYYDSLRHRKLSMTDILREQTLLFEETRAAGKKIIVEQKIEDYEDYKVPRDYKAYAFYGEIALILEINRNTSPSSVAWFDDTFQPVTDGRVTSNPKYTHEIEAIAPTIAPSLLDLARNASERVPSPFASIDMYAAKGGPMVGEVTLAPGGLYHGQHYTLSPDQQDAMGQMWREALDRIDSDKDAISRKVYGVAFVDLEEKLKRAVSLQFLREGSIR